MLSVCEAINQMQSAFLVSVTVISHGTWRSPSLSQKPDV